jgi:peptidoglycan/LPS O-acetylase OafA/YrhL
MNPSLKYRADIDGLRAIAVLGVIIYHAFPHALPGGFIGVDIFFVISGYLISGILYKGHREGDFRPSIFFLEFYARRIRRLFPALITLLVLCLGYGSVVLLPSEYKQLGKHVAAGTLFIQNLVFWQESGYFDTAANLKPLLHLWSLAVEEQFYIFFPPLLLLIWKRKWPLVLILSALLIASMVGNLVMSVQNRATDFFLTPYRAWEFLGGSLLAWWHYDRGHEEDVPLHRHAFSLGGAALLGLGMALIHKNDPYPGWRALLPVTGTLLLMEGGAGVKVAWVNGKILSNPAVVWIGLISYPLYLFHWPALSFVHIVKGEKAADGYIWGALLLTLILSVATYYLIEKPIRYSKSKHTLPALLLAFVIVGIAGMCFGFGVLKLGVNPKVALIDKAIAEKDKAWGEGFEPIWAQGQAYLNKTGGNGPSTLYFGDSNVQQYGPRIIELIKNNHGQSRGAIFLTCGGVPPIPGLTHEERVDATAFISKFKHVTGTYPNIDRVVIASLWNGYFIKDSKFSCNGISLGESKGRKAAFDNLGVMIKSLVSSGKKVTLLLVPPNGPELDPRLIFERSLMGGCVLISQNLTLQQFRGRNHELIEEVKGVALSNGAEVIDPATYLSSQGVCIRENANGPIRYDGCHLRPSYVREHVKYLDSTVAP